MSDAPEKLRVWQDLLAKKEKQRNALLRVQHKGPDHPDVKKAATKLQKIKEQLRAAPRPEDVHAGRYDAGGPMEHLGKKVDLFKPPQSEPDDGNEERDPHGKDKRKYAALKEKTEKELKEAKAKLASFNRSKATVENASARLKLAQDKVSAAKEKYESIKAKNRAEGIAPPSEKAKAAEKPAATKTKSPPPRRMEFRREHSNLHVDVYTYDHDAEKMGMVYAGTVDHEGQWRGARSGPNLSDEDRAYILDEYKDEMPDATEDAVSIETGPRGGKYYISDSGQKVYVK